MSHSQTSVVELDGLPDLVALHRLNPHRYPFLLASEATGGSERHTPGRFDILFCDPGESLVLDAADLVGGADFLERLDAALAADAAPPPSGLPFAGGWFVFLGYELAQQVEPTLALPIRDELPVAFAVRIPTAVVRCRRTQRAWLVSEDGHGAARVGEDLAAAAAAPAATRSPLIERLSEDEPQRYLDAIATAKRHIVDGDVFQANLSRAWYARLRDGVDDAQIYANLCAANPAPFAGLVRWRDACIVSSSPERLVSLRDRRIETRPIAGTRPRGVGAVEDHALSEELIGHPKERAEHVMLIDLERNDLGRVCVPGSVHVDELMAIESYAHVHHIVSNVSGRLRGDVTPGAALRAVFPGGTITGCPKVRCMQIIAALEGRARGPYSGSIGYLNHDGSGDFNILIRTLVRSGRHIEWRAGAGIVAGSVAHKELHETRAKARGLLNALNPQGHALHVPAPTA